ncbi:uncharacterized protein [Palaemon carinicauda]|uniref:uncharacterized protein n=1 Tax=Palaemon carinicauda TaxID=392227 RepID=UPI0035B607EF
MLGIHSKSSKSFFMRLSLWMIVISNINYLMAELPKGDEQLQDYCLRTHDGREYSSNLDLHKTKGVLEPCRFWENITSESEPSEPTNKTKIDILELKSKDETMLQNFCRNPGDFETPYCFSLNSSIKGKQSCPIPFCSELQHYRTSSEGQEYQGKLDFSSVINCQGACKVREHLGLSCPAQFQGNNGKLFTTLMPCDVPMLHEIPFFTETYRERTVSIPATTWYVPMSHRNITYSGSGELMLYLPDSSKFGSNLSVSFQIRLADPRDIDSFHFHINFLPGETFEDYYTVSFSKEGVEIQRIQYANKTVIIQEENTDNSTETGKNNTDDSKKAGKESRVDSNEEAKVKERNETRIIKKTNKSGIYAKLPIFKLRHDWLTFQIQFFGTRIYLYFEKESKPILQMNLPLGMMGMNEYQYKKQYVIRRFKTPRYVNFHSIEGTSIVALTMVNNKVYTCVEGRLKIPSEDNHTHIHPMAAMPLMYSDNDNPLDEKVKNWGRKLCLQLTNTPALVIFFSAPIYDSKNTDALKKVVTLLLEVQREVVKITRCMNIKNIDLKDMDISCDSNTEFVSEIELDGIIPVGEVVSLCIENYREGKQSIVRITGQIGENSILKETVLKGGAFLRYWTLMKKMPSKQDTTLSQLGPLGFYTFNKFCTSYKYINPLLSYCLMQAKDVNYIVHVNYTHQITWSKSGKSCFPWSYFKSHLAAMANREQAPEGNFCLFSPIDNQENRKDVHRDFWCHVDLRGTREMCEIPNCIDIITDMGCLSTVKEKLHISPTSSFQSYICNSNVDFNFYLDLDVPYEIGSGIRSQILNPEKGLAFYLRSFSSSEQGPVCFYLYCDLENYPLIEFKITDSSLYMDMAHLGVPMKYVEVSSERHSYYLNSWTFNVYTIAQTAVGWHLFHGDDFSPSITYETSHQLTKIQLSSCYQEDFTPTNQLVAVHVEPVLNDTEMREILGIQASAYEKGARVNRYYPTEKSISAGHYRSTHMIMQTTEVLSFWYFLYRQIPKHSDEPILRLHITDKSLYAYIGNSKTAAKSGKFKTGFNSLKKFYKFEIDMKPIRNKYIMRMSFKSVTRSVFMNELPSFYGMEVIKGEVKIVLLKTDK